MSQVNDEISDNKRIVKNTMFLYFRMILTVCIGLYTSRVVLQTLGITDYGIFNAVGGVVAMLGFLNTSMASSSQRFITYALGEGDNIKVNRVFVTSFFVHLLVAFIVLFVAETIGLWFVLNKMVIPENRFLAAFWVYQCSIISSIITILSVPYNSLIIAYERMSFFAYISIIEVMMLLGIVFLLQIGNSDRLILYAILIIIVRTVVFLFYKCYCNRNISSSKFRFLYEKGLFGRMVKFSLWSMNGHLALVGASQGINILLNLFFGPAINAAHGVATQVQSHVYAFCTNFNLASKPQITKLYANSMYTDMHRLVIQSSKFSFYLMMILSIPLIMNVSTILHWWLGDVPDYTVQFVIVMLLSSMVRSLSFPLIASVHATGNIKRFQIWEGTVLLMVVPVAYLLLRFWQVSPVVVVCVYLILEIVAQIVRVWIVLPMIYMPYRVYIRGVVRPLSMVVPCTAILLYMYPSAYDNQSFVVFTVSIVFCFIYIVLLVYLLGINSVERYALMSFIKSKISLLKNK